jgi:predicted  nucleic acid-binding Zn ribbon protein
MFVAEISWQIPVDLTDDQLDQISYEMLGSLYKNGQIVNWDFQIAKSAGMLRTFVMILEPDALDLKYANKYVRAAIDSAILVGMGEPKITILGESPNISESTTCSCQSDTYILYTHYLAIGSPVKCGNCLADIPLYYLPKTYDGDEYYDIIMWARDYHSCDTLQMHCTTGERFGLRQMSDPQSSLAKQGRKICDRLTELTGKLTYYHLFRYKVRTTLAKEKQRKCPGCGGEWLLTNSSLRFQFKCDRCRLVSNLSCSVI